MFKRKPPLRTEPLTLHSGSVVKTEDGYFFITKSKIGVTTRRRIPTYRVLQSWNFARIIECAESAVAHYPILGKLGFRDGTLIRTLFENRLYIIADRKRHPVTSPEALADHGLTLEDAILVSEEEADLHKEVES